MSHIVEAQTSIVQPDLAVLRQAVELVAGQHQGTIEPFYLNYYGKRHEVAGKFTEGWTNFAPKSGTLH